MDKEIEIVGFHRFYGYFLNGEVFFIYTPEPLLSMLLVTCIVHTTLFGSTRELSSNRSLEIRPTYTVTVFTYAS